MWTHSQRRITSTRPGHQGQGSENSTCVCVCVRVWENFLRHLTNLAKLIWIIHIQIADKKIHCVTFEPRVPSPSVELLRSKLCTTDCFWLSHVCNGRCHTAASTGGGGFCHHPKPVFRGSGSDPVCSRCRQPSPVVLLRAHSFGSGE